MGQYAPIEIDCITTNVAMNNKVIQVGVKLDICNGVLLFGDSNYDIQQFIINKGEENA